MYFKDFARAIWADWVTLVSGALSIVFGVWAAIFTPTSSTVRRALWISFAVGLVIAAYRIWVAEHKRYLNERERNGRPDLKIRFEHTDLRPEFPDKGYTSRDHFGLRVILSVVLGNMSKPTKITKLALRGRFNGETFEAQPFPLAEYCLETQIVSRTPLNRERTTVGIALKNHDLQSKLPIAVDTFDGVPGWLGFWFPALSIVNEDFAQGEIDLLITDGTDETKPFPVDQSIKLPGEIVWRSITMY